MNAKLALFVALGIGILSALFGCGGGGQPHHYDFAFTRLAIPQGATLGIPLTHKLNLPFIAELSPYTSPDILPPPPAPTTSNLASGQPFRITIPVNEPLGMHDATFDAGLPNSGQSTTLHILVIPAGQSFGLTVGKTQSFVTPGETGIVTGTVVAVPSYQGSVQLSVTGLPSGVTAQASTNPLTSWSLPENTFTLTFTVPTGTPLGSYPLVIHADDGTNQATIEHTLVVQSVGPTPTPAPGPSHITWAMGQYGRIFDMTDFAGANQREATVGNIYSMVLSNGSIYATDSFQHRIVRMNTNFEVLESYGVVGSGVGQFRNPQGIWLDGGFIYVADTGNNRIVRMNNMTGAFWASYGHGGSGSGQFQGPTAICVDNGNIYIADTGNNRIVRLSDMTGTGYKAIGTYGFDNQPGTMIYPRGLIVHQHKLYFTDVYRVIRMDNISGAGWTTFGGSGQGTNQFQDALGIGVDSAGHLYIADQGNKRIVRINDLTGAGWTTFTGTDPNTPIYPSAVLTY